MASANHLKALFTSHLEGDEDRFVSVALQVAAHEARAGHGRLADELRAIIDKAKSRRCPEAPIPISRLQGEIASLLEASYPKTRLSAMILADELESQIQRVVLEQRHADEILAHGLSLRRKLLLIGPPGTGKTLTASALAGELGLPLFQVRHDALITKYMGETAAKLRQIFDTTNQVRGIYFFDEFDAIGSQRGLVNDVGEIRRVLNSFLLMIEQDRSHSIIIAATNHPDVLDSALFRRFDDVLHYDLPNESQIIELLEQRLGRATRQKVDWKRLANIADGLNYAEVTRAENEVLKEALISGRDDIDEACIQEMLSERKRIATRLNKTTLE